MVAVFPRTIAEAPEVLPIKISPTIRSVLFALGPFSEERIMLGTVGAAFLDD